MKDTRAKYNNRGHENGKCYRFRGRRIMRHFERDMRKLQA